MPDPGSSAVKQLRAMAARNIHQAHRASTPLELLFDLVFVIAIASAAAGLHHAVAEGHTASGIVRFAMAFFGIWWAWMNYTWFASAYDNDDLLFRLLTMTIMSGEMVMASGIDLFFKSLDLTMLVTGYVVMRVAMVAFWLRAAHGDPERRKTTLTYAVGIALVQLFWVGLGLVRHTAPAVVLPLFALGAGLEVLVPAIAERNGRTPWHRDHIIERYGLMTIIVLGETLLSGSLALRAAAGEAGGLPLARVGLLSLAIVFALWWLYFSKQEHLTKQHLGRSLTWGYGHVLIFASGAAVGAGFGVLVDSVSDHAQTPPATGNRAVAIPVAVFLFGLWFVRDRYDVSGTARHVLPVFAALILVAPLQPWPLEAIAAALAICIFVRSILLRRDAASGNQRSSPT